MLNAPPEDNYFKYDPASGTYQFSPWKVPAVPEDSVLLGMIDFLGGGGIDPALWFSVRITS